VQDYHLNNPANLENLVKIMKVEQLNFWYFNPANHENLAKIMVKDERRK
jgi:hypothetical protein